ncbi:unnamed protein product [Cylindrotheca closterium]|uniref:Elongator complex protein 6 n=1 Tax=Cylindrotheca closterium TaxID=2856 RepID=A0AAD2FVV5_9STRA|nr:unnamed protein product [Cylindrotheca closterium]
MNANIPLEEVFPFSPRVARKVLICDSIETDGRFVCYTYAKQAVNATCPVLWLLGTPVTEMQVATGLKKMGCDAGASYLRDESLTSAGGGNKTLTIRSLASELATATLDLKDDEEEEWSEEAFLKQLYQQAKEWLLEKLELASTTDSPCWIILDDMSTLATMLSESLVYQFIDTLIALVSRLGKMDQVGILIRVSNQLDQTLLNQSEEDFIKDQSGWVGAGGLALRLARRQDQQDWIPWERSLLESMDGVVDVLPLASGYSREAHGRLIFSELPSGRGWSESSTNTTVATTSSATTAWNKLVFNYCIHDNGVKAIRLRVQ